ncbi:hypothetical protein F5887DRAFT_564429 [Amanita rubescens]|nr:hypothetical protein F5887DRAFT_686114 [Amanita rubescens]KAF8336715.1 hypothetical protein F5887DRAFT_564429 [Amanita rubescens]
MFLFFNFLCLSWLVSAPALPLYLPLQERDVVAPPVTAPNSTSVWTVGSTQTVVWDTSGLPPYANITNRVGEVLLGHLGGGGGLNLMLNNPLAQGFNITQGSVNVVVPNVPPRTDYLVVLMGDSGNASPTFAITGGSNSTVTPGPSTTQTSSSSTGTSTGGAQSGATSTPVSNSPAPTATAQSGTTPAVTNTFTTSGSPSSITVVVQPSTSTSTSTKTSGALSMRPIGATCLSVALIISRILL